MKRTFNKGFFVAGTLALSFMIAMLVQGQALKNPVAPRGILDLEFAHTLLRVEEILASWRWLNNTALWNTLIDFGFLASYTFFFSKGLRFAFQRQADMSAGYGWQRFFKLSLLPGILDGIENAFLLGWLLNFIPSFSPAFVYWMVWIKFVVAAFLFCISLPLWLYNAYLYFQKQ